MGKNLIGSIIELANANIKHQNTLDGNLISDHTFV